MCDKLCAWLPPIKPIFPPKKIDDGGTSGGNPFVSQTMVVTQTVSEEDVIVVDEIMVQL